MESNNEKNEVTQHSGKRFNTEILKNVGSLYKNNNNNLIDKESSSDSITGFEVFDLLSCDDQMMRHMYRSKTTNFRRSLSMIDVQLNKSDKNFLDNNFNNNIEIISGSEENENYFTSDNFSEIRRTDNSSTSHLDMFIDTKLREMKDKMMRKIHNLKELTEAKYENHIERIKLNVMQKAQRIKQVFNNSIRSSSFSTDKEANTTPLNTPRNKEFEYMRRYTLKNVGEKLDHIFDIHNKIESSIEKNFEILGNFLDGFDLFQDNPLHNFVYDNADDILNSWIFSKINFEKINLIDLLENDKIPTNLKNFIFQDTVNKFSIISIKRSKSYEFDRKLMYDNHLILEKLVFKSLDREEFKTIFSQLSTIQGIKFEKLKQIILVDCTLENVTFTSFFTNTEIIKMKNTLLKFQFVNLTRDFSKLKILSIKKCNFNNKNLDSFIEDVCNCKEFLENLQILDLSHNKISQFDLTNLSASNSKFYGLQVLALNSNKLYKFKAQNLSCLPSVKLINLSSNNFTVGRDFYELSERSKKNGLGIFVPISKNLFMMNNAVQNKNYIDYLIETLRDFEYFIKKIDLSFIFNSFSKNYLSKLFLNSNIQISLKKINLSNSSLDTDSLITFIKNNNGFINLRFLDISNNYIDDAFLETYNKENFVHLLENLEWLVLSSNKITENSLPDIENILKNQKKICHIKINYNPIENSMIDYLNKTNEKEDYDSLDEFFENLGEIKKEFKLVLSKRAELAINTKSSSSGFNPKKIRELNKIFIFEN